MSRQERVSRRKWLTWVLGGGAAAGAEAVSRLGKGEFPNLEETETENAQYRIFYSTHLVFNDPKTVDGADAILIEIGARTGEKGAGYMAGSRVDNFHKQLRLVLAEAKRQNKPVFLVDMSDEALAEFGLTEESIKFFVFICLETWLGLKLVEKSRSIPTPSIDEAQNRREMLKRLGMGIMGTYFLAPTAEALAGWAAISVGTTHPTEGSLARITSRSLQTVNRKLHPEVPELGAMYIRNSLIAQKSETVARVLGPILGRKPILNLYIGGAHVGVKEELHKPWQERVATVAQTIPNEVKNEGIIIRIDFTENENGEEVLKVTIIRDLAFEQ